MLKEAFLGCNDETDEKIDEKTDDEQPVTTDMPDLKSEESAEQRIKKGKELKMLRQSQMFSRLPIYLPQLKAGNNSKKLENEIRQLLYRFIIQRKTLDLHTETINLKFSAPA